VSDFDPNALRIRLDAIRGFSPPTRVEIKVSRETVRDALDAVQVREAVLVGLLGGNAAQAQEENVRHLREALVRVLKRAGEAALHELAWSLAKEIVPDDYH